VAHLRTDLALTHLQLCIYNENHLRLFGELRDVVLADQIQLLLFFGLVIGREVR
jgi:hypothetical protein